MSITLIRKTENAARSPYAAENDRRMTTKAEGLSRILQSAGAAPAYLKR